jgi:hypothetical protein
VAWWSSFQRPCAQIGGYLHLASLRWAPARPANDVPASPMHPATIKLDFLPFLPTRPTACASFLSFPSHTRSTQSLFYCSSSLLTVCRRVTVPRSLPGISQYTPWSRIYLKTTYSCWPYLPDLAAFSVTCKRPDPCFVLQINTPGLAVFNTAADVNCICIVASPAALVFCV